MNQTLTDAVEQNDLNSAENLLKKGYNVNKKNDDGLTPLMIAAGRGYVEMVKLLLEWKADVHIMDSRMGTTALHKAAQKDDNVDVAKLLVKKGAFVDAQAPTLGNTPLLDAVWHQHPEMVKYLLEQGARTELTTRSGGKPINIAENYKKQKIISLLKEHEASRAQQISSQKLMTAVEANDVDMVKKLIKEGVDIDEKAPLVGKRFDGYTPLLTAAYLGHEDIVQELLKAGAKPTLVDDQIKATPAHKAGYHGKAKTAQVFIEKAVEKGLDLNAQGPYNGYTALHDAIWHCHKETVEEFLKAKEVKLDLKTHTGHTALELAKFYCGSDSEIVKLIKGKEKT